MSAEYKFNSRNMFTGEVLRKGITITKSSGTLSLSNAKVTVYDSTLTTTITPEASATIDGGNVYALITAGTTVGRRAAIFRAVDGTQTLKARIDFSVVQG